MLSTLTRQNKARNTEELFMAWFDVSCTAIAHEQSMASQLDKLQHHPTAGQNDLGFAESRSGQMCVSSHFQILPGSLAVSWDYSFASSEGGSQRVSEMM